MLSHPSLSGEMPDNLGQRQRPINPRLCDWDQKTLSRLGSPKIHTKASVLACISHVFYFLYCDVLTASPKVSQLWR